MEHKLKICLIIRNQKIVLWGNLLISYGKVINKLCHFHIHDGRGNPPENHLALGDGEIDLTEHLGQEIKR